MKVVKSLLRPQKVPKTSPSKTADETAYYVKLLDINGFHGLKHTVPDGYIDYQARVRPEGKVFYFNFDLARELGVISKDHPDKMTAPLERMLVKTFSLQIINEMDVEKKRQFQNVKPNKYMATRYLQLQHPSPTGKTSGDGRSIWNGEIRKGGKVWDVSSCGTGTTALCPATALTGKFFSSGDPNVSYGNGSHDLEDAVGAALMSEIFYKNGIPTERTLSIIELPNKTCVATRVYSNLLRPSHFFRLIKQNKFVDLEKLTDFCTERSPFKSPPKGFTAKEKRNHFFESVAKSFGQAFAKYESEYIFCWLDWDGDNILLDGGVIDFGSVRQMGRMHSRYRYDDVERFSTNLLEQKVKARETIQRFSQIQWAIETKKKKSFGSFKNSNPVKIFDAEFEKALHNLFLEKWGFSQNDFSLIRTSHDKNLKALISIYRKLETIGTHGRLRKTADGVNRQPHFNLRIFIPFYIQVLLSKPADEIKTSLKSFFKKSSKAQKYAWEFHIRFQDLINKISKPEKKKQFLLSLLMRASPINRHDRITGDAIIEISDKITSKSQKLSFDALNQLMKAIVLDQVRKISYTFGPFDSKEISDSFARQLFSQCTKIIKDDAEGL